MPEALLFFIDKPLGFSHLEAIIRFVGASNSFAGKQIVLLDRSSFSEPDYAKKTVDAVTQWSQALQTFISDRYTLSLAECRDIIQLESELTPLSQDFWNEFLLTVKTVPIQGVLDQDEKNLMQVACALAFVKGSNYEKFCFLASEKVLAQTLVADIFASKQIYFIDTLLTLALDDCCAANKLKTALKQHFFFKDFTQSPTLLDFLENVLYCNGEFEAIKNDFDAGLLRSFDIQKMAEPRITALVQPALKGRDLL